MENLSLYLSIFASISTIISICFNFYLKNEIKKLQHASGNQNVQNSGQGNFGNTGSNNTFFKN